MMRRMTTAVVPLAAVAALAAWAGGTPAQAKEWPGPYDHDGGRWYADEARDYIRLGYSAPLPGWGSDTRPVYSSAPAAYYGRYPYAAATSDYYYATPAYGATPSANYSYGAYSSSPDNAARLRVVVPADAKVWFDGNPTKMTGAVRQFESPALKPGRQYTYDVKAQWRDRDRKDVTRTRRVDVGASADVTVDFTGSGE